MLLPEGNSQLIFFQLIKVKGFYLNTELTYSCKSKPVVFRASDCLMGVVVDDDDDGDDDNDGVDDDDDVDDEDG